jgi:hypothetical protein
MRLKFVILTLFVTVAGGLPEVADGAQQATERFLAACIISAQLDDPLGSEGRHQAYCRCRVDALAKVRSSEQLDQISADIEESNRGGEPRAIPLVGSDLSASDDAALACQSLLGNQ